MFIITFMERPSWVCFASVWATRIRLVGRVHSIVCICLVSNDLFGGSIIPLLAIIITMCRPSWGGSSFAPVWATRIRLVGRVSLLLLAIIIIFIIIILLSRPQRWIVTIPSLDQWLPTIGNHWKTIVSNGCRTTKPLKNHWHYTKNHWKTIGTNGFQTATHCKTIDTNGGFQTPNLMANPSFFGIFFVEKGLAGCTLISSAFYLPHLSHPKPKYKVNCDHWKNHRYQWFNV